METRNKEMEEMKDELEKNKAAASKPIRSFWLTEPYNYQKKVESLKEESERIKPEQTQNRSSSDSQETLRGIDVNANYNCICLRNKSDQDKPLGGRQLKVQINNSEPITYTFDPSMKLKAGDRVNIRPGGGLRQPDPGDLVWEDLKPWRRGERVQVSLQ
ncbi:lamin-A-like [Mugil cephalus]|uniref:lamin-A-like n=1 Tax=Mugil cephalus TaxID=48193 RepID=UPI001FB7EB77|nr:lamin-A-like [Mugil cephalus]